MSVLNQSGEEQVECPLCMEALEVDDLNFYPCSCGYQICRFCWHRIRTDENGLCPACRKAYAENPADFIPLTKEQVSQLKVEKRQREQQRKAKLSESRKHLSNVRVVQKNLVFVVGLPPRLADAEVLKKHEYFGKFGKIHKVVINQSTTYAGSQGPSASAYVTYMRSDDALRAIQSVNNIVIDGRTIKSSLGTTKYCSHFMKNQTCPKADCMYLHFFGDPKASFTKEQMHAGKHQEYERKLHEMLLNKMAIQGSLQQASDSKQKSKDGSTKSETPPATNGKESWPQLSPDRAAEKEKTDKKSENAKEKTLKVKTKVKNGDCSGKNGEKLADVHNKIGENEEKVEIRVEEKTQVSVKNKEELEKNDKSENSISRLSSLMDDNSSFFSQNSFQKMPPEMEDEDEEVSISDNCLNQTQLLNDSLPNINSSEDWEAAFGFSKMNRMEELAKQGCNVKDTLETFGNGYNRLDMFSNLDNYQNRYETNKLHENIMDVLSHKPTNYTNQSLQFTDRINGQSNHAHADARNHINGYSNVNSLDHQMSKFFNDFCKNGQKDAFSIIPNGVNPTHDGLNQTNGYLHSLADRQSVLLLQQREIEEQLMSLNLKKHSFNQQMLQNGYRNNSQMFNGEMPPQNGQNYGSVHNNHLYQNGLSVNKPIKNRAEDELDFDPFHETQKGLAELLDSEADYRIHSAGQQTTQLNGLNHSHNHIPPPPPGFVQSSTHMNSFGSKILPFLNMGNSQPQQPHQQPQQHSIAQNNWSSSNNYNHSPQQQQQQQQQQQKGLSSCNDWKMLDPAIVTSSRNFLLTSGQMRDQHFNNLQQPLVTQQLQNGSFNYQNYSNYNPQMQQQTNYTNFSHINNQQNLNWLGNELNSQIATPPGFRANNQATKQQEC